MLFRSVLAALASSALALACSSGSTTDHGSASPSNVVAGGATPPATATTEAQACTTPHRTFAVKPVDYFRTFATTADAKATLEATTKRSFLAPGNDYEARATSAIAKVFAEYQKLYPETTEGMTTPPLALVEDIDDFNAMAFGKLPWADGTTPSAPWVFKYNRGFFVDGITDDQIIFITAHELGHLLLRNTDRTIFAHVDYREQSGGAFPFGEYQTDDAAVKAIADRVIAAGTRVGQLFAPELNGVGTQRGANGFTERQNVVPLYNHYLDYLHTTYAHATATPQICMNAKSERAQIRTYVNAHYVATDAKIDFGADAAAVDALTKQYASDESTCLAHVQKSFADVALEVAQSESPDDDDVTVTLTDEEKNIDVTTPNGNVVSKILTLAINAQTTMRTLIGDPATDYAHVRVFTQEDDADESAVRILKLLGIKVADAQGASFLANPDMKAACDAVSAGGVEPPYGGLVDPHHSICWRQYRALQMETALATCDASWPK